MTAGQRSPEAWGAAKRADVITRVKVRLGERNGCRVWQLLGAAKLPESDRRDLMRLLQALRRDGEIVYLSKSEADSYWLPQSGWYLASATEGLRQWPKPAPKAKPKRSAKVDVDRLRERSPGVFVRPSEGVAPRKAKRAKKVAA